MQLVVALCLFGVGWIAGRFERWSDQHVMAIIVALAATAIAVERGIYLPWFDRADPYSDADNIALGLTPNALAAIAVYTCAFLAGSIARARHLGDAAAGGAIKGVVARIDLFPKSDFIFVKIANERQESIVIKRIAITGRGADINPPLEWTSVGDVQPSQVQLHEILRAGERMVVEIRAEGLPRRLTGVWVHGIECTTQAEWHKKAVLVRR